jgi:hypothetical protein
MNLQELLARLLALVQPIVHVERVRGEPILVEERRLTPITRAVRIGGIGRQGGGGLVWNHPIAVEEEIGDGIYRTYPIRDVTQYIIAAIFAAAILVRVLLALLSPRRS